MQQSGWLSSKLYLIFNKCEHCKQANNAAAVLHDFVVDFLLITPTVLSRCRDDDHRVVHRLLDSVDAVTCRTVATRQSLKMTSTFYRRRPAW